MFRAKRARGEDVPEPRQDELFPGSLESVIALGLSVTVLLASVAFLERSSRLSRVLAELHEENARQRARTLGKGPRATIPRLEAELVVLISLDTLRADHLDAYGYARQTAPHLAALAAEGVLFRTVCAQSAQTLTSHKSLFTGKYPNTLMREETGADLVDLASLGSDKREYLVDTFTRVRPTLAEHFRAAGYATCALTDGAWMSRETGFQHGFEPFDASGGGLAAILPRAEAWLAALGTARGFLFVHAYDVHCPYPTREPFDSTFCRDHSAHLDLADKCGKGALFDLELSPADRAAVIDHYDASILSADAYLGEFFATLRSQGLYERALIVVTSDHGESLGERGFYGHGGLHPEQLFVPLLVKPPRHWKLEPHAIDEPVELVDLYPTLLAFAGLIPPGDLDGRSLVPTLFRGVRGKDYLVAQTTFEEAPEFRSSPAKRSLLRPGRWQILQDAERGTADFYTLERDPAGLRPHPVAAEEFSPLLDLLLERHAPRPARAAREDAPGFSAEIELELEALGYGGTRADVSGHRSSASLR
jgi:arylsulfatase A-like enzyme